MSKRFIPAVIRKEIGEGIEGAIPFLDFYIVFINEETKEPLDLSTIPEEGIELIPPKPEILSFSEEIYRLLGIHDNDTILKYIVKTEGDAGFGSFFLTSGKILREVADLLDVSEYYILPSSIHEFLIALPEEGTTLRELKNSVQKANSSEALSYVEVLSNNIYKYNVNNKKLMII